MSKKFYIACDLPGQANMLVECRQFTLQRDIKQARREFTREEAQKLHAILSQSLSQMLPAMQAQGQAVDAWGEHYNQDTFAKDLVCVTIYNLIGNDEPVRSGLASFGNLQALKQAA